MSRLSKNLVSYRSTLCAALLAILFAGLSAHSQSNNIIYACQQESNGKLRIVSDANSCTQTETLLSWNNQGPAGPQGPKGDTGATGPQGIPGPAGPPGNQLRVVDSINQEVGIVLGNNTVAHKFGPNWVQLTINPLGFVQGSLSVFYETPDCSGTGYLSASTMIRQGVVNGTTLYYAADPLQLRVIQSAITWTGGVPGPCQVSGNPPSILSGTVQTLNVSGFTPPFSIQATP